ncbi:MAG: transketolase family protein [Clostridia bacterium]|nr:transketolase family protein [Clostridia bacterium]
MMKSTRKAYGEFLSQLGEDKNVVVLDADLATATKTDMFMKEYPERHIDVGIAEQDLVGTACGLALSGKTVFASTFAIFMAGRAYDQVRNTAAYSHVNVNLCATHAGVMVGEDGPTHQCIEDIALMNVVPTMKVLSPADDVSTKKILKFCLNEEGPKYIRLGRSDLEDIYTEDAEFKLGGSNTFGDGTDGTVFAYGPTVSIALNAQKELKEKGINIRVVDLYSIKPVDRDIIIKCAKETDKLISIEDHSVIGGIGSIISNVLCEEYPKKLEKIGIKDTFGKSGNWKVVYEYFGLTKDNIINKF